jgi:hypothetical protein
VANHQQRTISLKHNQISFSHQLVSCPSPVLQLLELLDTRELQPDGQPQEQADERSPLDQLLHIETRKTTFSLSISFF